MAAELQLKLAEQPNRAAAKAVRLRRPSGWLAIPLVIALAFQGSSSAQSDELQDYARECDQAIGATVPDFDCDDKEATEVPVTHPFDGFGRPVVGSAPDGSVGADQFRVIDRCDKPNRLNKECDPGSRFHVLTRSKGANVVAHCRKRGNASGQYDDIAVIQFNRNNGATCFYQALANQVFHPLSHKVEAPSKGRLGFWMSPQAIADSTFPCAGCHDNGPLIRSPYLNQITGQNALPGSDERNFNQVLPYCFVGKAFASWKAFKVEVDDNECTRCHRLGVNNLRPGGGTALVFGMRASGALGTEKSKNPPSADSPIWMPPSPPFPPQVAFDQGHINSAKAIHDCATHFGGPLPPNCNITQFAAACGAFPNRLALMQVIQIPLRSWGSVPDIATIIGLVQIPLR